MSGPSMLEKRADDDDGVDGATKAAAMGRKKARVAAVNFMTIDTMNSDDYEQKVKLNCNQE